MFVIGLTGGIGTGKSRVAEVLRSLGAEVIDADGLGHQVYRPHTVAWRRLVDAFGEGVLGDGQVVDRKRLGAIVFGDARALAKLNSIVHPGIREMIERRLRRMEEQGVSSVVMEAAVLLEAGWEDLVDEVWVTAAPEEEMVRRIQDRNHLDASEVRARIRSQMPERDREARADVVIENSGSVEDLARRVEELWRTRVPAGKEKTLSV